MRKIDSDDADKDGDEDDIKIGTILIAFGFACETSRCDVLIIQAQ